MKKQILVGWVLVICLVLAACTAQMRPTTETGTQPQTTTAPTAAPTGRPTTIPATMPTTLPQMPETQPTETVPTEPSTAVVTSVKRNSLSLGSVMPNVLLKDLAGETYTLYDLLAEKKMVMLNFWFIDCPYCVMEFPHLQQVYEQYQETVEVFAINPYDNRVAVRQFQADMGLTFPILQDDAALSKGFGITGYPTSVVIDRNGVVCLILPGAATDPETFAVMFDFFTAEDYQTTVLNDFEQLLQ